MKGKEFLRPRRLGLRERKRQQTRRELIGGAMRLLGQRGYEQTTVAEIAAAAGVSTKTFFSGGPDRAARAR
jgi:AcrR family transcriptional regulator